METGDDAILVSVVNNGQHNIMEQLSVYSVWGNTCKILMNCGKFHVTGDLMFLLSTDRSEC